MLMKRCFDLLLTIPGLLVLSPVFLAIAVWIKLDSPGPVFFRQTRVGLAGMPFAIYKFRTMVVDAERLGRQITVGADWRVTRSGRFLRKCKLDELPQLFNVLIGEMSLVGPRPEVPRYVLEYTEEEKAVVLSVLPGITDNASIFFRNENEWLSDAADPEVVYIQKILPVKIRAYRKYVQNRSLWGDCRILWRTLRAVL